MTENDYIAEYVKEKYPNLLGFNYGMWKFGRMMNNAVKSLVSAFKGTETPKDEAEFTFDTFVTEESEEE